MVWGHLNMENWALRNSMKSWLTVLFVSKVSVKQVLFALLKGARLMQWKKSNAVRIRVLATN